MKPAKEYIKSFWGEINGGIDSSLRYISAYDIALVIKAAQLDAIEATCKRCAEESTVEVIDHEELSIETLPANDGKTVILPIYGVDEDSILKVADKMKEELNET